MQDLKAFSDDPGPLGDPVVPHPGAKVEPFLNEGVVPGQRLLAMAAVLSDGAALMHARLRPLDPDDRDAILDLMADQMSGFVTLWTDLVRGVVTSPSGPSEADDHDDMTGSETEAPADLPRTETHPSAHVFAKAPTFGVPTIGVPTIGGVPDRRSGPDPDPAPEPSPGVRRLPRREVVTTDGQVWATPLRSVKGDDVETDPGCDPDGDYENDRLTRDELTGVLNRQAGFAALGRDLDRCRRAGERFVLGYLDVDGLKDVNAREGSQGGDELLRKVTAALRATLRSYDVIMRLGGDEFLFSLPGADMATAELRANEFGVILAEEAAGGSASVGYSELRGNDTLDEIISRAEIELVKNRRSRLRSR